MTDGSSTFTFILQPDQVDSSGKTTAHYYPNLTAAPTPVITPTVQVANPKPDVVYTHETVTSPTPEPTPIPTVTAIALPNKVTMPEYPPVSDYQFNSPDQYKLPNQYPDQIPPPNQYPDQIPPPNQYPDQYPPPNPYPDQYPPPNQYPPMESNKGYNTHPCVTTSLVLLFLLAIGFAMIYALDKTGTIKF